MAAKLRKGDKVVVTAGADRGKSGEIVRVLPAPGGATRVMIRNIAMRWKHVRPNPAAGQAGGRQQRESAVAASACMLLDPRDGRPTRVGFRFVERRSETTGEMETLKIRFAKRSGFDVD